MAIEIHFEKRINNVAVLLEADNKPQREYLFMTMFAALFVLGLLFYGWQHYRWIQYGYRIEEAQKKKQDLDEIGQQLRIERSSLRSLQVIDAYARGRLGMIVPAPGQMVTLSADAPLTIPVLEESAGPVGPALAARK